MTDKGTTDQILDKLDKAVEFNRARNAGLDAIRTEQREQAKALRDIQSTLDRLAGADHNAKLEELKKKQGELENQLLKPEGVVDKLRIDWAKRLGTTRTWSQLAAVLGAIGTILGILLGLKII